MTIKRARRVRNVLVIAGAGVMLLAYIWEPFIYIGAITVFSCLIPQFLFIKCPHCGKQLGENEGEFCQFCGKRLDG